MTIHEDDNPTAKAASESKSSKANFDDIYVQPDPRDYYRRLGSLDYEVPQHGSVVFNRVLEALPIKQPTVVDVCCSYGVNAALLKHDLDLDDLVSRYTSAELADLTTDELAASDREFYASRRLPDAPAVVGIDASVPAVEYALRGSLLDAGAAEDLESSEPSALLVEALADADLFTVTGGIGYITERTVGRLLDATPPQRQPWFAALSLRTVPYDGVADVLQSHGLVTEQLPDTTFPQRRFADDYERGYALRELAARGIDPTGKESTGRYHVNVYLSRPGEQVQDCPIDDVLAGVS